MRLFVAVPLTEHVRQHLDTGLAALRESLTGWRLVPPAQWHVTLAFLGEVAPDTLPELTRRLARSAGRHGGFDLRLRGVGAFGSAHRARVLWVGVTGELERLRILAGSASAQARRCGIEVESRRYRPHVTVGRHRTPADLRDTLATVSDYSGPCWPVDDVVLVESQLGAQTRHRVLERFPLR